MRICLIANPKAGASRPGFSPTAAHEALLAAGAEVVLRETGGPGTAREAASAVRPGEFDAVVVGGGDGTLNEVANGLAADIPVGIMPLGTMNVLARELRIPVDDLAAAAKVVVTGDASPIDMGWCNGRRFLLMAGIGFDADTVREVPPSVKDFIGGPAYVLGALRALAIQPEPLHYRITLLPPVLPRNIPTGRLSWSRPWRVRLRARGRMLVVANAGMYAGQLLLAPNASIRDGQLDLCLFREKNRLAFLGQLLNTALGRQHLDPNFLYRQVRRLHLDTSPPAAVQLDGDYFGRTPVEIRILPRSLRVLQPGPVPSS